jgi:hypothetical protein
VAGFHFMKTLLIVGLMALATLRLGTDEHLQFPHIFWSDGATWYMPIWEVEQYDQWTDEAVYHYDIEFDEFVLL